MAKGLSVTPLSAFYRISAGLAPVLGHFSDKGIKHETHGGRARSKHHTQACSASNGKARLECRELRNHFAPGLQQPHSRIAESTLSRPKITNFWRKVRAEGVPDDPKSTNATPLAAEVGRLSE